jgi:hypothetical protein
LLGNHILTIIHRHVPQVAAGRKAGEVWPLVLCLHLNTGHSCGRGQTVLCVTEILSSVTLGHVHNRREKLPTLSLFEKAVMLILVSPTGVGVYITLDYQPLTLPDLGHTWH